MFRALAQSQSQDSHGSSMRLWLYVGAVTVGFSLMALEDKTASERMVDAPEAAVTTSSEAEPATAKPGNNTPVKPADLTGIRTVSAEFTRHVSAR